jgi:hypothetical protein
MKILAQAMAVEVIRVCGTIKYPDLNDPEPKIQIQALRDLPSLEAEGNEASSDVCEVDSDSAIRFEGLDIERVSWVDNDMFIHFPRPTDVAIFAEDITDNPSDPLETPLRCITVTDLGNVQ